MGSTRPSLEEWETAGYLWLLANQAIDNGIAEYNPAIAVGLHKTLQDRQGSLDILAKRYGQWCRDEQKRADEKPLPAPETSGVAQDKAWQDRA